MVGGDNFGDEYCGKENAYDSSNDKNGESDVRANPIITGLEECLVTIYSSESENKAHAEPFVIISSTVFQL